MNDHPVQTGFNPEAFRSLLRKEKIAARTALSAIDHHVGSQRILAHLAGLLHARTPGVIGFCWPIRGEVDCRPLIDDLTRCGWQAVMPVVVERAAPMRFRSWSADAPMTRDPYGIPVPATEIDEALPDVLLLPLVAFDAAGYRLGYGGGYFDRTLAICRLRPLCVGVGFESAAIATLHPAAHDVPLDVIATERGLRHFAHLG